MNDIIETFIHDHLFLHLVLIAVSMTAIIIAMGIDFISGIQKAKQRGELRTSKKYKMTATKAKKYFNPFLTLVMSFHFQYSLCYGRFIAFSVSSNRYVRNHGKRPSFGKRKRP